MPDMAVTLPVQAARNKPKLLDQVCDVIRRKHFSIRTEEGEIRNRRTESLLFDVDLAVEEEQDKCNTKQWSQQRLDNPE